MTYQRKEVIGCGECRQLVGLSRYLFRDDGEVLSLWSDAPRILKGGTDKDGYRKFVLIGDDGVRQYVRRASAQCEAWHGARPEGHTVRHLDGTRTNDAPANLAWGTQAENIADKHRHGTAQIGEKGTRATITDAVAGQILTAGYSASAREIASRFGTTKAVVDGIRSGRTFRHVGKRVRQGQLFGSEAA